MVFIQINFNPTKQQALKAFDLTAQEVDAAFRQALTRKVWSYPRKTKRFGGSVGRGRTVKEVASSPRNIVDSGTLAASQRREKEGNGYRWTWGTKYAAAVHEGYVKGGTIVPARPWTRAVLEGDVSNYNGRSFKLLERYQKNLKRVQGKG